jgi:hypothetical protein
VAVKDFADGQQQPHAAVVPSPVQTLHLSHARRCRF